MNPARVVIEVPIHTRGSLNAREGHWRSRYRREQREIAATLGAIQLYQLHGGGYRNLPALPVRVHMVRVSPGNRMPDLDNVAGYLKKARDAVAAFYKVDDADKGPIAWSYAIERGPRHLIRLEIEAVAAEGAA